MPPWWRKEDRDWIVAYTAAVVIEDAARKIADALAAVPFTWDAPGYAILGHYQLTLLQGGSNRIVLDIALEHGIIGPGRGRL